MAYSPGDLSSLLLNGSNESSRMSTLGGAMALFRAEGSGSAQKVLEEEQVEEGPILALKGTSLEYAPKRRKRRKRKGETEEEEVGGGAATTNTEECDEDSPGLLTVLPAQVSSMRKRLKRKKEETENGGEELTGGGTVAAAVSTNAEENEGSSTSTDSEKAEQTIFVGNLPLGIKTKRIAAYFKPYGQVESVRLRSLAIQGTKVANSGDQILVRRVCAMKGKTDESVKDSANAYVVFSDKLEANAALADNGVLYEGRYLRIDRCIPTIDPKLSVFVGNLPFSTSEQSLWEHFSTGVKNLGGGGVRGVRIIRDKENQVGKGFAYILLADQESVHSALQLHGKPFNKRKLRVFICGKRFKDKQGGIGSSKKKALQRHSSSQGELRSSFEGCRGGHSIGAQRRIAGKEKKKWRLVAQEGGGQRYAEKLKKRGKKRIKKTNV